MKFVFCHQCDRVFYAERSTAKYCSATCRKAHSRNQRKISHYQRLDKHEEVAAIVADKYPVIWRKLEEIRDTQGNRALRTTLEIIELIIQENSN